MDTKVGVELHHTEAGMVGQIAVTLLLSAMAEPLVALATKPDSPALPAVLTAAFFGLAGEVGN